MAQGQKDNIKPKDNGKLYSKEAEELDQEQHVDNKLSKISWQS